jgi:hypothetical protein
MLKPTKINYFGKMMPKYFPMTEQINHQSALGQYGHGGGGHSHD